MYGAAPADLLDGIKDGRENVCGVIGCLVLKDTGDSLHAHACVDMLGRQHLERFVCLPVILQAHIWNELIGS